MRNGNGSSTPPLDLPLTFRIPHSAFRIRIIPQSALSS
jgi:hypothetical protein